MKRALLPLWLSLAACGDFADLTAAERGDSPGAQDADDEANGNDLDQDFSEPAFWTVRGVLILDEQAEPTEESYLDISFYDAMGDPWPPEVEDDVSTDSVTTVEDVGCTSRVVEAEPGPARADDAPPLAFWAVLTLEIEEDAWCPWSVPVPESLAEAEGPRLALGFGAVSSSLQGPMAVAGLEPDLPVFSLSALYTTGSQDRIATFGVVGTDDQFAGVEPDPEGPLAAGAYTLRPLVLLPLP
ncbi:MAG: hypothetical protein EA397_19990 [Deltaproteobacteria bacterium]|nr:MAG: hypothetical protein EA397_19990 [Deltaproteobacteria bacterium]